MFRLPHARGVAAVMSVMVTSVVMLAAACDSESTITSPFERASERAAYGVTVSRQLGELRVATNAFHDSTQALAASWSAKITSCMWDVNGGMGFHYGNVGLIDGEVQVDKPELLLYEPTANGKSQLVAVEYVVPYTFRSRDAEPPVLFGQRFARNDRFQLWGLHAWVWKENPAGMFAGMNPQVSCASTTDLDVVPMAH